MSTHTTLSDCRHHRRRHRSFDIDQDLYVLVDDLCCSNRNKTCACDYSCMLLHFHQSHTDTCIFSSFSATFVRP